MYRKGLGRYKDEAKAYAWLDAAAHSETKHKKSRDAFVNVFPQSELSKAKALSKIYYKNYVEPYQ